MIKSILIANRGEIAIRIARTAKRMGIKTYGIRTKKEPNAVYLQKVDAIVDFPETDGKTPEFLDIKNLVKLAVDNGIESMHPGYGYLSENADFAQACIDAGVTFIGPSPKIIRDMGDKIVAKEIAQRAGVPMLGGTHGGVASADAAIEQANAMGYPVIIKAASGGGGRGMRICWKEDEVARNWQLCTAEATTAFNDPTVFIEKYLQNPKHIEFQIVADKYGNVVHLGERECSIQRKHQKLMEEAPSPALSDELRERMATAAVNLAKEAGYESLGTVEFLLDAQGNFFFMEMNTRIQVEHPVTEMITGLNLVELQLLIASGEHLPVEQKDIKLNGWAIECRINAEDVQGGFTPSIGIIRNLRLPSDNNIRIDSGVRIGTEITPFFDSMIAKLIVHGKDRNDAIELSLRSLQHFHVMGVKTTIPFCKTVLHNEVFRAGDFNTSFIESVLGDKLIWKEPHEELIAALLAVSTYNHDNDFAGDSDETPEAQMDPWVLQKRIRHL
ncbi:MAG: ATP-grasp domain-containing protein [Marinilabiliaceae bacterium]|nr:ATP-grasp domain-containing protein [Marinilabiliaceae bacterium]